MKDSIGVAIIARNVQETIAGCIESLIDHVDQCVVVKAGESTDKTPQILDELKAKYPDRLELYDFEWIDDFSAARNYSFSFIKTDWVFWCDADDVIVGAENLKKLAQEVDDEVGGIWFPYDYCTDEFGNVVMKYERERLLRMSNAWIWRCRMHETVSPMIPCNYLRTDMVRNVHKHAPSTNRNERNFKLLNLMYDEDPEDKRVWLYLGHQHFAASNWMQSAGWYVKFGSDPQALPLERFQALCYASKAFRNMRDTQAIKVAWQAIDLYPQFKDGYLELAHSYMATEGNYDKAIHFAMLSDTKGLMQEPPSVIFVNPLDYTCNRYALIAECYLRKNQLDESLKWAQMAFAVRPTVEFQRTINTVEAQQKRDKIGNAIKMLAAGLHENREFNKLEKLPNVLPAWFKETDDYDQIKKGAQHYAEQSKDYAYAHTPDGDECVVNVGNTKNVADLLDELDMKYKRITFISPKPETQLPISTVLSQKDAEELIIAKDHRRVINLRDEPARLWCTYEVGKPTGLFVRMYLGQSPEYWTPHTIKTVGCGGSETAAATVASYLAKQGHRTFLYSADNQVWDGVVYRRFDRFNPNMSDCDWFISSRIPDVFNAPINGLQKWLWVHDIHCYDRLTPNIAQQLDVIVCLSHWHVDHMKRTYPFLKDAEVVDMDDQDKTYEDLWTPNVYHKDLTCSRLPKMAIIGNGIEVDRFKNLKIKKVPHSFIWCSSPDRGLEELLRYWKDIRKELPDATLKIFYGWNYFDNTLFIPAQREFKERIRMLIQQDGVQWCDRIGQTELAHEMAKAQCLVYPPPHNFRETYGIAFLEAQAAGTLVFYRMNGALGETVGERGIPLALDLKPEQIVKKIVSTLGDSKLCGKIVSEGRKYALQRSWDKQSEKMLRLYNQLKK